ncbi:allantoate permease [Diplocarpon rosae]|nr:allantoate permease [Diplocarpon rosae]
MAIETSNSTSPEIHGTPKKDAEVDGVHVQRLEYTGIVKDTTDFTQVDKEVAKYTSDVRIDIDEATNTRLKKLINRRVLLIMMFTYFLQALDKGTLAFASIMGIKEDTGLVGSQYSWLTTCIYIAVLIVEFPTNWLIQRVPIAKYLAVNIILWGTTLMLHAVAKNFTQLVALRTLLGMFEACCQPIFIVMSAMWFKREEQAAAVSYWYMMNGAQQIVGGLLAYCFTLLQSGPLKSWQALFISYGGVAILWGFFVLIFLPDSPMRAKSFSEADKMLLVERVRGNQTGMQNRVFKREQVFEALMDPQTWCYCGVAVTTTLPTSGLGAFANIVITSFDFSVLQTQLLAMVLGFYIIFVLLSSSYLVKKTGQNLFVMLAFLIPSFVGTIVLMTVRNTGKAQQVGLLIGYYLTLSFWSAQTLAMSLISRNVAGSTKKSTVIALNFVAWAVGNAIGPQVFIETDAPRYLTAFTVHLVCYSILVFVILFLRWHLRRENAKKDALAVRDELLLHAFEDLSDRQNANFRYVF